MRKNGNIPHLPFNETEKSTFWHKKKKYRYIKIIQSGDVYYSEHIPQQQRLPALLHICFSAARAHF